MMLGINTCQKLSYQRFKLVSFLTGIAACYSFQAGQDSGGF